MDNSIRFDRFVFCELKLTTVAAGVELTFGDYPQLRNAYVQAIEAYTDTHVSRTPLQLTVFANAQAPTMLMTLINKASDKKFEYLPYYTMIRSNNGGYFFRMKNFQIDIQKSKVFIGTTGATANHALAFGVYYTSA